MTSMIRIESTRGWTGSDYESYVRSGKYGRGTWVRNSRVFLEAKFSSTVQFACHSIMQYASNHTHSGNIPNCGNANPKTC